MRTHKSFVALLIFLHFTGYVFAAAGSVWRKRSSGISEGKVNCLFAAEKDFLLVGTDKAIYRASSEKSSFLPVLQNHGQNPEINQIIQNVMVSTSIYSATDSGVFISTDQGKSWTNIFSPTNLLARKVYCVLVDSQAIYVGTADGLYVRRNSEQVWKEEHGQLGRKEIFSLVDDEKYLYAATASEIYRIEKSGTQIQKVYSSGERLIDRDEINLDEETVTQKQIKDMEIFSGKKKILVATEQEIVFSQNQGDSWENVGLQGLPVNFVKKLSVDDKDNIYASTQKGAFFYKDDRWQSDILGLTNLYINDIKADKQGNYYLASNDGFYAKILTVKQTKNNLQDSPMDLDFKGEPTIKQVQSMAIAYANVNPAQINSWHNQSRAKALLPTLAVGLNRADTEMYHWDTGPNPDVLRKGRDYLDWSTALSWDFSDFVWSSDHTSIDSRSKLMSELRQDILDQVTRLYFERRRIQIELASNRDLTSEISLEKKMRVEELTALLDGLTGGKFSDSSHPK